MTTRSRRLSTIAIHVVFTALVMATGLAPAGAASNGQWSVQPTGANGVTPRDYFYYVLKPGQSLRDSVSVVNLSSFPKQFALYPADAYNTPVDAGFALRQQNERATDAGSWLVFGINRLTVPPQSRAAVNFDIRVPVNAGPGDHAAGIVAEDITPNQTVPSGKGVVIQRRVASRVYLRVEGPLLPQLRVTNVVVHDSLPVVPPFTGHGRASVTYTVTNVGNVRMTSTATLKISGLFGRTLKTFKPRQLPELLPRGSVQITESWKGLPIVDHLTAHVHVAGAGITTDRTKGFWDIPWLEVLVVLVVVALLYARRRYGRGRDRRQPEPEPDPVTPEAVLV